ncbi:uncharacterized protein LOC142333605 [Lycorma delicatula]|uniref:uncharacterized protein LOC142333605 n=1 Tax=Lycorma delicatula TaxID=130591 RepID=UPI003F51475B
MLRALLANVNRSMLSHSLVTRLVAEKNVDFLVITEPNVYEAARTGWNTDTEGDVAFRDVSGRLAWRLKFRGKDIVAVETAFVLIVGTYVVSPNVNHSEFVRFLDILQNVVLNTDKRIIMLGDFNSKMVAAGGQHTNRRGELLTELMETVGCHCVNDDTPTYEARGHTSILDLTILDNRWKREQWSWGVLPEEIASDHYATTLSLNDINFRSRAQPPPPRFTADQLDSITDRTATRLIALEHHTLDALSNIIKQEMDRESRNGVRKCTVYWWTAEIAYLR